MFVSKPEVARRGAPSLPYDRHRNCSNKLVCTSPFLAPSGRPALPTCQDFSSRSPLASPSSILLHFFLLFYSSSFYM